MAVTRTSNQETITLERESVEVMADSLEPLASVIL